MKENSETSLVLAGLYAVMLVLFGSFLGFLCLMSFPLQAYASIEERANELDRRDAPHLLPGDGFYIEGPTLRSREWESRRSAFIEGSQPSIRISVGEINAWLEAKFRPGVLSRDHDENGLIVEPSRPSIGATQDGLVFLNLPAAISVYGMRGNHVLSAQVSYAGGDPTRLRVHRLQVSGAPVPFPRVLGARMVSSLIRGFHVTEEYAIMQEAWGQVDTVEVVNGAFLLNLKRP